MGKVVERHNVLRTFILLEGIDKPVQVVTQECEPAVDLPGLAPPRCRVSRNQVAGTSDSRSQLRFQFLERPPYAPVLVRTGEHEITFSLSHHHILMDGWCLSLLLEEFFKTYEALCAQRL